MDNYSYYFIKSLTDCDRLAQKYTLERCLTASKTFCNALDNGKGIELYNTDDECLQEIIHEGTAKYGARTMYAAFLHLSGNIDAAYLHLQAHRFIAQRALKEIDQMLSGQE